MIFLATVLASERTSLHNINEAWGAGFEIVYYSENGFTKLDNHAFILIEGEFDETGKLTVLTPRMVQYYRYYNDILLISAIELLSPAITNDDQSIFTHSVKNFESFYFVPSLDTAENFDRNAFPGDLSFETNKLAIGYSVILDHESAAYPGVFYKGHDALVTYKHQEGISIKLPRDVDERIRSVIITNLSKGAK